MDGWMDGMGLSYTTVTPRASLQSDANNAKKESMSYEVYRSCEGEDHILVSDILRDDRRAERFSSQESDISPIHPTSYKTHFYMEIKKYIYCKHIREDIF